MSAPIDFVITWVDGSDPEWQKEKNRYEDQAWEESKDDRLKQFNGVIRYRNWDNLQYWFRGVEKFAPWVHKIYFVTWGHIPSWLNTEHPNLVITNHKDFMPPEYLPTFQSPAIEDNLHRIPGLNEQFVYFNDDMFLIKKCCPTDFFVKGLPCDCAILNMEGKGRSFDSYPAVSMEIANDHFQKHKVIKESWSKWFNVRYVPEILRTFLLLPWPYFNTLYQPHLPSSFLKSTFKDVWQIEHEILDKTCREKFRKRERVSQYLFLDWQRVTGRFVPRSIHIGKNFFLDGVRKTDCAHICKHIAGQRTKMICINDAEMSDEEFERSKAAIKNAFQKILPEKCGFEK